MDKDKSEIVKDYIKKFPRAYKLTLAKMIMSENPGLFSDVETVRNSIRYYLNANGDNHRKSNKFRLPDVDAAFQFIHPDEDKPPQITTITQGKALIMCDIHSNKQSLLIKEYCKIALNEGVDIIILDGDVMDNGDLSRWPATHRQTQWNEEIEMMQEWYADLRDIFPTQRIIYKKGNHEIWYDRELWKSNIAKQLFDVMRIEDVLQLNNYKIETIGDKDLIELGKLVVAHGHESKVGGKYVADRMLQYYKRDVIFGHFHRYAYAEDRDFRGRVIRAYSLPCARNLNASYTGINNNWVAGFAIVDFVPDDFTVQIYFEEGGRIKRH